MVGKDFRQLLPDDGEEKRHSGLEGTNRAGMRIIRWVCLAEIWGGNSRGKPVGKANLLERQIEGDYGNL